MSDQVTYPYIARAAHGRGKGERCRIISPRSNQFCHQVQVQFEDGKILMMERRQLRRSKDADNVDGKAAGQSTLAASGQDSPGES